MLPRDTALLVLTVSLQAVAPSTDHRPRFLDRALEPPVDVLPSESFNPLGGEVLASLGISLGMMGLGVASVFVLPSGDCPGCLMIATVPVALGLTPLLSSLAVWAIESGSRPAVAWWPIFLASAIVRIGGALLMGWGASAGPQPLPIVGGLGLSLVGGAIAEVVVARWGAGQAGPGTP